MAKQTKENKRGFVLYSNTLRIAERVLPKFEQRGQLLTMITAYTNGGEPPTFDKDVTTCFEFIRDGIEVNCDKYSKKREKQKQYYEEQKSKSKAYDELTKTEKSAQSEKTAKGGKSTTLITNNSNSNGDSHSVSNGNSDRDSNSDDVIIDNNFVVENKIDINNSISDNKYTLPQVQEILERERIFFKQNWLRNFYRLNNARYKWKYDPISAAYAFIAIHPESVKGENNKESSPRICATPPTGKAGDAYREQEAVCYQWACKWWDAIYKEIRPKISDTDAAFISEYIRPNLGYSDGMSKCLRLQIDCESEANFRELMKRAETILVPHADTIKRYVAKLQYGFITMSSGDEKVK